MKIGNTEVYGVIYKITNKVNGKVYIGQTTLGFDRRYGYDIYNNTHNIHLKTSIMKYGINFFEIIKVFDIAFSQKELDIKEDFWINFYNSLDRNFGYNKRNGGNGGKLCEETRKKISESMRGRYKGEKNPQWGKRGKLSPRWGRKFTLETRMKLSEARKNIIYTEESRLKMSESHKGKKHSEETKKKMSKARKGKITYSVKVICKTTNLIFNSALDASKYYNVNPSNIIQCCKNKRMSAGKLENGDKLTWAYLK